MPQWRTAAMFCLSFGSFIALWKIASTWFVSPYTIPPPDEVLRTALPMIASNEIARHMAASLARVAVGFGLGSVLGILVGVLMGRLRWAHDLLDPVIEFFRFLSPTAMIPIA